MKHHATKLLAVIVGYVACVLAGCSGMSWKSPLGRNHPLTGRIWDVSSEQFIDRETLVKRLAGADFVLLGERHDNPDHHMLQAEVLRSLIAVGRRPAVGLKCSASTTPALFLDISPPLRTMPPGLAGQ